MNKKAPTAMNRRGLEDIEMAMPQTDSTTDAVASPLPETITRNGEEVYVQHQSLIDNAPDMYIDLIDLIEAVELMPDASDPEKDLYIAVNVARVTLDRIKGGMNQ